MDEELKAILKEKENAKWVMLGDDDFKWVEPEYTGPELDAEGKPIPPTSRPDNEGEAMPEGPGFRPSGDFSGLNGSYRYTGNAQYVVIPDEINGEIVTSYSQMFRGNLTVVAVKSTSTAVTDMTSMFLRSESLHLNLSELEVSGVTNMASMFSGASGSHLLLSQGEEAWNTKSLEHMTSMFANTQFEYVDVQHIDTSKVENFNTIFKGATIERLVGMEYWDTSSVSNDREDGYREMFQDAEIGTPLQLNSFITNIKGNGYRSTTTQDMFNGTTLQSPLDLSSFGIFDRMYEFGRYTRYFNQRMFRNLKFSNTSDGGGVIYVKDETSKANALQSRALLPEGIEVIVGGKGYIPPPKPIRKEWTEEKEVVLPFSTVEKKDRNMNSGESKTTTEGKPGVRVVTTRHIEYMDGTYDREERFYTKVKPVNKVISIGTLVEEIRETVKEEYDYYTVRYNDYEANKGERVEQRGEKGYLQYDVVKRVHNDDYVDEVRRNEKRKEPVDELIAIGMIERTNRITKDEIEPHKTHTRKDYERNHNDGKPHVEQSGKDGKVTHVYNVITYTDATPQKWELIPELTKGERAVNEILIIGMVERSNRVNKEEVIPFKTKSSYSYEYAHKDRGEPHVIERGKEGKITRTYQVTTYVDSTPQLWDIIPELTKRVEPESEELIYGLIKSNKEEKEENILKFEVETRISKDLLKDEERVAQEGVNGLDIRYYQTTRYIVHPESGLERMPLKVENTVKREYTAAQPHIIEVGAKEPVKNIEDFEDEEILKFKTEYVDDATLYEGQEIIESEGIDGKKIIKWQLITYHDDTTEEFIINVSEIEPVNKIIRRGTKDPVINEDTEIVEKVIPYETSVIKTNDLKPGIKEVKRIGIDGRIISKYLIKTKWDGSETRELIDERRIEPIFEIILLGVSAIITRQEEELEREELEYREIRKETDTLYVGQTKVKTKGVKGLISHTYVVTEFEDGRIERALVASKRTEPTDQVILVGTRERQAEDSLKNIEPMNNKMTGDWLFLDDGDRYIRVNVKSSFRPLWGYL